METKKCKKCGRELPVSEFYASDSTKDGLFSICKDCHRKKCRDNYRKVKAMGREIDWEERRYEIAKDMMVHEFCAELTSYRNHVIPMIDDYEGFAKVAIKAADSLIKELKEQQP